MTATVQNVLKDKTHFIFDLDGTLIDSNENHKQGVWNIVKNCSKDNINLYQDLISFFDRNPKADRDLRYMAYKETGLCYGVMYSSIEEHLKNLDYFYWQGVGQVFKWIDGAVDTLLGLSTMGKKLSILTNGGEVQHRKLNNLKSEICEDLIDFDYKVVTGDYGRDKYKPNPHCLNKILSWYEVPRNKCVYIGNTIHDDYGVAYQAGIDFVLVDFEEKFYDFDGNKIFDLKELLCK